MEEASVRSIKFFTSTDARAVKETLSAKEVNDVQKSIETLTNGLGGVIDMLKAGNLFLANGKLLTGHIEFAAFRIETLSLIFHTARKYIAKNPLGEELFKSFLGDLGHEVGFTYGRQLLKNLRISNCIPADDFALIELWTLFENDTGAGVTTVNMIDANHGEITLSNNPLGYYYSESTSHSNCYFYAEYFRAILNEFSTSRPRLAQEFMPDLKPCIWKVSSVKERPRKNLCIFEYELRQERLRNAFDLLHAALTEMDEGKLGDAVASAREALVMAQKEKLFGGIKDIPKNFYKAFQTLLPKQDFKLMDETYQRACSIVHKSKTKSGSDIREIIRHIRYCIHEIERLDINENQLNDIRRSLTETG